jgi:lipopolysaccharide biosynthesis glycosyltransferase
MLTSSSPRELVVVTATDDGYVMPLAVTIRSALDRLDRNRRLRLYILDGGISAESKRKLAASWNDPRLTVEYLRPDMNLVSDLMVSHHVNSVAYLRLLMPRLLPADVSKVIYLDADMLVRRDLGLLWDEPLDGAAALAVPCIAAPYLDSANQLPNFARCHKYLAASTPVMNFRELGLPADGHYLNSGMMVVDLDRWRREDISAQSLTVLREHAEHVLWWDQYALNVVLADRWRPLDYRWNQGVHIFVYPSWRESPLDRQTYRAMRDDPWIVHFCSPSKPWHYFCAHPCTAEFYATLDHTAWNGWRPERPADYAAQWWDFHYTRKVQRAKANFRTLKMVARETFGRAA